MSDLVNDAIDFETRATFFSGAQMEGTIKIGNVGFEFDYLNQRIAKNILIAFCDIRKVEINISVRGKLGKEFTIVLPTQAVLRFSSEETGKVIKILREKIGKDNVVRAPNLLSSFGLRR